MLDRFFAVLPITPSFLVRFRPVKYRIEALNVLHALVRGWSVRSSFRSGQWSGQTLVKLGQSSPNSGKCISNHDSRVFGYSGPQSGQKRLGQTSVELGQLWSNLVKLGQPWSTLVKIQEMCPRPCFEVIWRDEPSSDQAGLVWVTSFCVLTSEKIPGVKMGLWQLSLLCLAFLGTRNC